MKLDTTKSYIVDIETYSNDSGNYRGNHHSGVLYHMPDAEMQNHLDDDDPKCYYDTQIDREATFSYHHPVYLPTLKNELVFDCDIENLLDVVIGDRMDFTGEPRDYYYTIIGVSGIYECYWDEEDNRWWHKNENIFDKYIEENQ
jgi:hypothetical protein